MKEGRKDFINEGRIIYKRREKEDEEERMVRGRCRKVEEGRKMKEGMKEGRAL